ncbi:hypothetical protein TRFO_32661 [Tritrichomonas foetus]|uniref:Uncharacterized protein n=1 Tax=Tritrichomonas foetus TaxID=1144522 RepID=A0A1J4JPG3_9EUKA|nr:hypothetical protein TRFO_32661 [Tritrichomonas foetus]|eukprot:OHT00634.1 hypothetical protein TRFO_32661 [Tritrichomonas foetus]
MNSNTIEFKKNFKSHRKVPPLSKYLQKRTPPKTLEDFKASRKNSPKKTEKPLTPRRRVDHVKNLLNSSKKNKKNKTHPKKETQKFKFSIELDEKANNKHKKGQIQDMKQIEIEKKEENESIIQINDQKFSENQEANEKIEEIVENDEETIKIIIDDDEINFKIKKKFKKPYICDRKHIQINDFKVTDHNEIEFKDYNGTKSLSTNVEIPFYDLVFTCESEEEMNEIPHQELVYNCESEEEVNEIDYYEFTLSCESEEENEQYLSDEKIKLRFYTRRYYCESEEDIPDEYHVRNIRRSKSEEFILYHERRINCESEEEINEIPHEELTYYCESEEDIPDEMTIIQMKESQKLKELLFYERRYNYESEEDENEIELMNADDKLKRIYFEELRINCESEEDDNEVFHDDYKYQCESEEDLMDSSYEDEFDQLDILKFHRIQYKTHRKCESEEEINEDEFYADDESSLNEEIRLSDHAPIINEIDGFEAFEILDTNTSDSQEEEDEKDDKYLHEIKEIEDKEKSESITINNFILPDSIEINNTHHNLEFDHKDQINQNISDESYTNMESSLYYSTSEYNDYYTSETNTYNAYDDYSSIYNSDTSSNNDSFNDSQSDFGNDQSSHRINVSKALHEAMRLKFSQPKIQVKSNKPIISPRRLLQQSSGSETPSMSISIKKKPKSTNSPVTSPTTDKIVYSKQKAKIQIKQQLKEEVLTSRLHFVQNESPRRSPFTVNSNIRTQSNMDQKIKKVGDFLNPSNVRWLK